MNEETDKNEIRKKILITEDEEDIALFLSDMLSDDYDLLLAATAEEALAITQTTEIDIALVDYKLPDMSGLNLLVKLHQVKPSLPVIIVTAFGDEDVAVKAFRLGALDYIKKPFCSADLEDRLSYYLRLDAMKIFPRFDETSGGIRINKSTTTASNIYKIQKALNHIQKNYTSDLGLASIANVACMSLCHFSRTFKLVVGEGCQEYLNRVRIEKAKELLRKTTLTVTGVSLAVGYNDLTHFGRTFKKHVGLTPSQYKENCANSK